MKTTAILSAVSPVEPSQPTLRRANVFLRGSLYLYLLLLPFETIDPFGITSFFSLTKMAGILFAALAMSQPQLAFARPPAVFFWFMAYLLVSVACGAILAPDELGQMWSFLLTNFQNLIAFWLCSNLMRDDKIAVRAVLAIALGGFLLALLMFLKIGSIEQISHGGFQSGVIRATALGENNNAVGYLLAIASLCMLGFWFGRGKNIGPWRHVLWPPFLLCVLQLVRTGSRGAMLALLAGCLMLIFQSGRVTAYFRALLVGSIVLAGIVYAVASNESARRRWEDTLAHGSTAGRTEIFETAVGMFLEKPIFGWGPMKSLRVLAERLGFSEGDYRDVHNVLLAALISTGLAGTIPLLMGIGQCVVATWKGRRGSHGSLPLMLIIVVLVMSLSGNIVIRKITWVIFGYCAASSALVAPCSSQRIQKA